jgi:hypothetical protein
LSNAKAKEIAGAIDRSCPHPTEGADFPPPWEPYTLELTLRNEHEEAFATPCGRFGTLATSEISPSIPRWIPVDWVRHQLQASTYLVLFAYSDKAAQIKLGLFREVNL